MALPKDNVFSRNLGIDVLEIKDVVDEPYLCLNILDLGTTFQQVVLLRQGHGSPSSRECLDSFVSLWVGWAGWPQTLSCDRGVHNRGVFARTLAQHGVLIRQAGVESPEQIGRVERHGGLFKAVLKLVDDSLENRPVLDTNDLGPGNTSLGASLMEPEFERGNTPPKTRPRSFERGIVERRSDQLKRSSFAQNVSMNLDILRITGFC